MSTDEISVYDDGPRYIVHDPFLAQDRGYFPEKADAEIFLAALKAQAEKEKPDE